MCLLTRLRSFIRILWNHQKGKKIRKLFFFKNSEINLILFWYLQNPVMFNQCFINFMLWRHTMIYFDLTKKKNPTLSNDQFPLKNHSCCCSDEKQNLHSFHLVSCLNWNLLENMAQIGLIFCSLYHFTIWCGVKLHSISSL